MPEVSVVGQVVNADGVKADPRKVEVMKTRPAPTSVHELRCFMGLTSFSEIHPRVWINFGINFWRRGVGWKWTPNPRKVFEVLKWACTSSLLLGIPDFTPPFEMDASEHAIGAVLVQKGAPVGFKSHPIVFCWTGLSCWRTRTLGYCACIWLF